MSCHEQKEGRSAPTKTEMGSLSAEEDQYFSCEGGSGESHYRSDRDPLLIPLCEEQKGFSDEPVGHDPFRRSEKKSVISLVTIVALCLCCLLFLVQNLFLVSAGKRPFQVYEISTGNGASGDDEINCGMTLIDVEDRESGLNYYYAERKSGVAAILDGMENSGCYRLLSVDGVEVHTVREVYALLKERTAGETIRIVVSRDHKPETYEITLTKEKDADVRRRRI